ncbi:MAG: hypothetical protein J0L92_19070 [Deltaproteobacteria bacterium]|nr:hypothetical protein [Deltaproteobacteria bacterium]
MVNNASVISDEQLKAAEALRATSVGWIASADSKATTIASVLAVVMGVVSIDFDKSRDASSAYAFWAFLALATLSIFLCVSTIWPRTNRRTYVPDSLHYASPTYFGDIPRDYHGYQNRAPSDLDLRKDTFEQAYVVARIAAAKMKLIRATIACFAASMLALSVHAVVVNL